MSNASQENVTWVMDNITHGDPEYFWKQSTEEAVRDNVRWLLECDVPRHVAADAVLGIMGAMREEYGD